MKRLHKVFVCTECHEVHDVVFKNVGIVVKHSSDNEGTYTKTGYRCFCGSHEFLGVPVLYLNYSGNDDTKD